MKLQDALINGHYDNWKETDKELEEESDEESCYHCGYTKQWASDTYSCPKCGKYFYGFDNQ
jgi:rubrerythrin